ncbi:HAMP domain-containing protein [Noviherbaspirillum agri]
MAQQTAMLDKVVLLQALDAMRNGDFSVRLPLDWDGIDGKIADTFNAIVTSSERLTNAIADVSHVVGTEGNLGRRVAFDSNLGSWSVKACAVNTLIDNLVQPIRDSGRVIGAVARGVLTQSMDLEVDGRPLKGEFLKNAKIINTMLDQLNSFSSEVTRVAREVGTEGKLGVQAQVPGVAGAWKDLTDNVNAMAGNLTVQLRDVSKVATAIASGDLGQKITVDVKGEILQIKDVINTMVDQLNGFASEVTRVAREVGTEGKLGVQAQVPGVAGTWKDLTDNVNAMAGNLTVQLRDVSKVATAIASGDLGQKITVDVKGEILQIKDVINTMVDQLNGFAGEVTRVAREVGTEGKLGVQAQVPGVAGTWKDLTDNVNAMAGNLTVQLRDVSKVATAIASGDLTQKITVDVRGEILQIKNVINTMVDQLNGFAGEVTRVAREVGTEGKLGVQAQVPGVAGTWKDLTDNVNAMAGNLTVQLRDVSKVATAIASGDLGQKITVDVKGEILQIKDVINTMVDQLNGFAGEVTRVAREVGIEGKLGGQAEVRGVSGVWRGLTDNVNLMASNLTAQVRNIATVTTAVATGDLSKKITVDVRGEVLQLKETINTMVDQLNGFAGEVTRVAREVGTEGRLGGQAYVPGVGGVWKDLTDNVNLMASNLTGQMRNIAAVTTAVANGDLSRKITVDVRGEILELKNTINVMVDQLNAFGSEVTRVAREVGMEGKLGGQAIVTGISGVWKDLTESVNMMADNLTDQVRGIAKVVTGVAQGNLKQKMMVPAKGEVASLAETINNMIDTLATFSDQVTRVAREVGVEGRLGGQAVVPGASGSWKDLVDNVNELAANLTTQVRAIGEVATAVTKGDLTRSIQVAARGEVAELKDNINQMIRNLKETTQRNTEQDWLKTNLARFTRMLQGQRDIMTLGRTLLSELAPLVGSQHAVLYIMQRIGQSGVVRLKLMASYGYQERKNLSNEWSLGEGVVGQAAFEKQRILISNMPENYVQIVSGLGQAAPRNIVVLPILFEGQVKAVIELATFEQFQAVHLNFLDQLAEGLGIVFNSIETASRTETLLQQSQSLAGELKAQQDELQKTNAELEQKARQLSDQNAEVERKNREIEVARGSLQDKAEQLALTSKYKSEFLANMSHELRTPLNSLLLLAEQMRQNIERNLTPKQLEMIRIIHGAGSELLHLINDILDLSKIESGSVTLNVEDVTFAELAEHVEQTFRHVAEEKGLAFRLEFSSDLPATIHTDGQRLKQVLKNLLSNAIKFTSRGGVTLSVQPARAGWRADHPTLNSVSQVIAFSVADTGIGIPASKQRLIFEAFQQADASTSRRYGGTGLGLAISREIAQLLEGELQVESEEGVGSTFTFYVPIRLGGAAAALPPTAALPPAPLTPSAASAPQIERERQAARPSVAPAAPPRPIPERKAAEGALQSPQLLIIEDDPIFAKALEEMALERGFRVVMTASGNEGIALAGAMRPDAITLDLSLPDCDGWDVIEHLKADPQTSGIPVHVISVRDQPASTEQYGIMSYLAKPADIAALAHVFAQIAQETKQPLRALLVIEKDPEKRDAIIRQLEGEDIALEAVSSATEARAALASRAYQGMVLDLDLPDTDGHALLQEIRENPKLAELPVVIYTARPLDRRTEDELKKLGANVLTEGARSLDRLMLETALFLHRVTVALPGKKRAMLEQLSPSGELLKDKLALVVDDDVRNLFALTGLLENQGMRVVTAENGMDAIERLHDTPGIDIVLMDIMMPEMDGYETTQRIRQDPQFKDLPIIALTAKAMLGDREKCLAAGASDYASKPIDTEQLLSQLRVWLYK